MGKRIAIALMLALLILLFAVSQHRLAEFTMALRPAAQDTMDAVHAEDWENAVTLLEGMYAAYRTQHKPLLLFLRHSDLLELEIALRNCLQLARVEDQPQCLMELEHTVALLTYLQKLEGFHLATLF